MLNAHISTIERILPGDAHPIDTVQAEGQALVAAMYDGNLVYKASTGATNEVFAGVALMENIMPTDVPLIVNQRFAAGTNIIPMSGIAANPATRSLCTVNGGALTYTSGVPVSGEFGIAADGSILLNAAQTATAFNLYFSGRRTLNVAEARYVLGDGPIGVNASHANGVISRIVSGEVFTDQFDETADWPTAVTDSAVPVKIGAGGKFTCGAAVGAVVTDRVYVTHVPTADNPFLGLRIALA